MSEPLFLFAIGTHRFGRTVCHVVQRRQEAIDLFRSNGDTLITTIRATLENEALRGILFTRLTFALATRRENAIREDTLFSRFVALGWDAGSHDPLIQVGSSQNWMMALGMEESEIINSLIPPGTAAAELGRLDSPIGVYDISMTRMEKTVFDTMIAQDEHVRLRDDSAPWRQLLEDLWAAAREARRERDYPEVP